MSTDQSRRRGRWTVLTVLGGSAALVIVHAVWIAGNEGSLSAAWVLPAVIVALVALVWTGPGWARWVFFAAVAPLGLLALSVGVAGLFLSPSPASAATPALGGGFLVFSASLLVFSESVADFMASRRPIDTSAEWERFSRSDLARRHEPWPGSADALDRARRREFLGRVTTGAIGVGLTAGVVVFAAFVDSAAADLARMSDSADGATGEAIASLGENADIGQVMLVGTGAAVGSAFMKLTAGLLLAGMVVLGYGAFFVLPFLVTLPMSGLLALTWKRPARFLLFRPLNRAWTTRPLRRFLRQSLSPLGHCYTLADADVRVPLHIRIPWLLGQLSFLSFRARKIRRGADIGRLVAAIKRTTWRNFNWCFSYDKIFAVACVDEGWQACVRRLVDEVDIVIFDVGGISAGVAWEIRLVRERSAVGRCVFIVEESHASTARARLAEHLGGMAQEATVVVYADRSAVHAAQLRAAVVARLAAPSRHMTL